MAAIEAYGKGGFSDLVLEGKHEFVEHYNFDSPYWKTRSRADHPEGGAGAQGQPQGRGHLFPCYRAEDQARGRLPGGRPLVPRLPEVLPRDADSAETNYLLAEALFESHQYSEAATEYEHTAYNYPKNAKSATAAYAGLVSYQKGEESLTGADKEAWHKRATDAGVKFAQTFPEHPDSAGVLTRAAEEIFASGDLLRTLSVSQSILARQPPVDAAKQRIAWTLIGQSYFDEGDFAKAEPAFIQARALAGTDEKMRSRPQRAGRGERLQAGRGQAEGGRLGCRGR